MQDNNNNNNLLSKPSHHNSLALQVTAFFFEKMKY